MSTLHDDALRTALKDAARQYTVPPGATEHILEAARVASQRPRREAGGESRHWTRRRFTLVAAVAIVLAVLGGSLSIAGLVGPHNRAVVAGGALTPLSSHLPVFEGSNVNGPSHTQSGSTKSATSQGSQSAAPPAPATQQTKVVSVGSISISVAASDFNNALARVSVIATSVGGYVSSSKVTAGSQAGAAGSSGVIELRVPQKQFGSVVARTEHLGHVVSAVTNSTDVTSQYVDYESRIGALQASRSQYLAIMARASSIGDILAIQAQVNVIESEIEQLEGQRNLLVNQAAYGTLTVAINQGAAVSGQSGVGRAWSQSISGFVAGVEDLIRAAGPALFGLLCLAALLLLGRFGWRASQRRFI
jgi:hypothetical protein